MQNNKLSISVVIPAYNAAETIRQCIDAVENQSLERDSYEVIVVDNNSTDGTGAIIRSFPNVHYYLETRKGSASARNAGLKHARGRIIAFTDADCIPARGWLEQIVAPIESGEYDVCGGEIVPVSVDTEIEKFGKVWFWPIQDIISGAQFYYPYVITANAAYAADMVRRAGDFDPTFPVAGYEDTDLGWRSYFAGARFCYVPQALVLHHHRTSLQGLFYMGYKGGFGREILINKFRNKDVQSKSIAVMSMLLIWSALLRLFIKSKRYEKRGWYVYDMTFRAGQLWGAVKGKNYIKNMSRDYLSE